MAIELSNVIQEKGRLFDWADKVVRKVELSEEDKSISQAVDVWAKKIGNGEQSAYELSQFITKIVEPEVYNPDSEILSAMFTQGSMGEFDSVNVVESPKNNLLVHESAARSGNVDKSYIDFSRGQSFRTHLQLETEIRMSDLRQNGYKSIANLTNMAIESLNNKKFNSIFNNIDTIITVPSAQGFQVTGGLNMAVMDEATGYLVDRGTNPILLGLSTDLRGINRMDGYETFYSENMKNALNMNSTLALYNGVKLGSVNASHLLADGSTLLPKKKLFGIADTIGEMTTIGSLRTLQTPDNSREVIGLKFTGFEFMYTIIRPEKICKVVIS